jgi:hypothetical protein
MGRLALLVGALGMGLGTPGWGQAPIATLGLFANATRVAPGGILRVDLATTNPAAGAVADLYAAVLVPGGGLAFRRADGTFSVEPAALVAGSMLAAGTARIVDLPVPSNLPAGTYTFLAAYVRAGTARDLAALGRNLVSDLASVRIEIAAPSVSFQAQVRPIFTAHCTICHSGSFASGELDLASDPYRALVDRTSLNAFQNRSIPRVDPGRPDNSYLIQSLLGTPGIEGSRMPLARPPLGASLVETIRAWVAEGAANN